MKLLIVFVFLSFPTFAQDVYYVSHVSGKVKKAAGKKNLILGQALTLQDSLIFATKQDYVCLISPVKGSRTARYEKDTNPGKRSELVMCLKDVLFPSVTIVATASRGGMMINSLFDFENYLTEYSSQDIPMLIIDSSFIYLGRSFAGNPKDQFFYARYQLSKQTINKKIGFRIAAEDGSIALVLNDSIYRVDGKPVDESGISTVQLFYYDAKREESIPVGAIRLRVVSSASILEELCVIKTHFAPLKKEDGEGQLKQALLSHLKANYGKADSESEQRILKMLKAQSCR